MNYDVSNTHITSDAVLTELILQTLDKIIGSPYRLIDRDLPFNIDHAILAINSEDHPVVISFNNQDGGQAFLNGLNTLAALEKHRACIFRLYPELFRNKQHALRSDDILLYILAPTLPPGSDYLRRIFTRLRIITFQSLLIDGEPGLLIDNQVGMPTQHQPGDTDHFRSDTRSLNADETAFFDHLTTPG
jgi:hypothetical protein